MARLKLLCELELKELRRELRDRGLKAVGNREALQTRLREELIEEGEDADTYLFELNPDVVKLLITFKEQMLADFQNVLKGDSQNETCAKGEQMYTSVKEVSSPELKTLNEVVEIQSHEIRSYSGLAREVGVSCDCNSKPYESSSNEKKCGDCCDYFEYKPDEAVKEHLHDESYRRDLEPADVFLKVTTSEKGPSDNREHPPKPDDVAEALLQAEGGRKGFDPTDDWSAETSLMKPDVQPDAEGDELLHVESYQPAPQACPPYKSEDVDLSHNFPSYEPDTHPKSPLRESHLKQTVGPMILVIPAMASCPSPCVKWLPSVQKDRRRSLLRSTCMALQPRCRCDQVKVSWTRRRKRHLLNATLRASSSSRGKPTVTPTDRPPPSAMKLHIPRHEIDSVRDGQI